MKRAQSSEEVVSTFTAVLFVIALAMAFIANGPRSIAGAILAVGILINATIDEIHK